MGCWSSYPVGAVPKIIAQPYLPSPLHSSHTHSGAFSEVKVGVERSTGNKFAIKIIDRAKCKGKENMIETEVSILKRVKHENIIQLYEMYEVDNKIYLVMEMVTGGELFDEIVSRGKYTETDAARIVYRILSAVDYLHSMGIAHRDLKVGAWGRGYGAFACALSWLCSLSSTPPPLPTLLFVHGSTAGKLAALRQIQVPQNHDLGLWPVQNLQ